ncbi:dienelactone hydrolase [Pandoraea thiooxydans]|uniref:Dienelactone hydrolase n=1 Tax=Pandoraea thiooxydans TaxID=445709 RepID=A0A0G3EKK1_9BURK|nr:dienelactone hydrolase family protein [Pandoraea thiooxydans]AKJ67568.1 dienelactone hydrolase [Pandoraea thiooxydans]APR94657.1 dienelactone hydrolase [Pandoraea thiooxydans]
MRLARLIPVLLTALATLAASPAFAKMVARPVDWTLGGTTFKNVLVYDDASTAKRPGLVMVPNWFGVNDTAIAKAKMIAGKDYVILLTDMYGAGVRPTNTSEAQQAVAPLYHDRSLMRARIGRAFAQLKAEAGSAPIDLSRLAAIGFCFGGAAVLDLARSGANVKAVVAFHGDLSTDDPALAKNIKARVLAINGADDAFTMPQVPQFTQDMRQSPADWEFVEIGHAVHCFTETEETATTGNCRYNAKAAARSYRMMHDWLNESFAAH